MSTTQPQNTSRRQMLQVGGLGLMGVTLPRLLQAAADQSAQGLTASADACVVIFLNGGPSHLDMWDMKPDAGEGIRGEFKSIATSLPGYQMSEHLPRMAQLAHRSTIVRSMHHGVNNAHAAAVYAAMTGHDRGEIGGGAKQTDYPTLGSVVSMIRPPEANAVSHVVLPYITKEGAQGPPQPGFFAGFMGRSHDPLFVLKDPNAADFSIPELTLQTSVSTERLQARRALFDGLDRRVSSRLESRAMTGLQNRAIDLLTSPAAQQAFQISSEPESLRDSYGRNIYGQSLLLARRLLEAGTRLVTLSWAPDANATWDTHSSNFVKLKGTLLPQLDAGVAGLVEDLADRGMLERTVIAVMGDFGRTPKVNGNSAGRDHWNYCYSLQLIGGGFHQGLIYGASDETGAFPARDPLIPGDIVSTIYHCLGIRHDRFIPDQLNRPHRLVPTGEVVYDLLG
ncbi:MAG: DUF1501 domain-containing protein [Planctomycetota bacterium]|nr:DUF1501 domain-containing protein [Planctomycetota bacterium]MDA1163969.1 DUF1501 domain-containing protein [Planctomycetota bacterium]